MRPTRRPASPSPACTRCRTPAPSDPADPEPDLSAPTAPGSARPGGRRLLVGVLGLALVAGLAFAGWAVLRDEPYRAHPKPSGQASIDPTSASALLTRFARALHDGDPAAARRLGAGASSGRVLADAARTARRAHLVDLQLRYLDEQGGLDSADHWPAAVDVSWRYAGFDRAPANAEVRFTFASSGGRVLIAGVGGGADRTPIWLQGAIRVVRTPRTLVLAAVDARRYAQLAARAVPIVHRVLAHWRPALVVEVPRSAGRLQATLAAEPGEYDQIAAVTTSADGSVTPRTPIHIFVNPAVFSGLKPRGSQVVMSHEAVHVATDAANSVLPLWLVEGFADYVALRDVRLPLATTAGQILGQVKKHGAPRHLPGPTEFDTTQTHLGASYEAAWVACRLLAQRYGEQELVDYYRALSGGAQVGPAFRTHFGLSLSAFTRSWRAWLVDQAGRLG